MKKKVLACRFDLPFYLRLPSSAFTTWDPEYGVAAFYPVQRMGHVSFSKSCIFQGAEKLLDSISPNIQRPPEYKYKMTCPTKAHVEVPTLSIDSGQEGGFSELRAYTEITIFIVISEFNNKISDTFKDRAFQTLNHFLDVYRIITQDPYVYRIDDELDIYLVDYSIGAVPQEYQNSPAATILKHINDVEFPREIGKERELKIRLNTLEDLFPGKVLEKHYLENLLQLTREHYEIPLHYELILNAQAELKRRNYHVAILEAETAFEVYIANVLVEVSVATGRNKGEVLKEMEYPGKLSSVKSRLRELDSAINKHRKAQKLPQSLPFYSGTTYTDWNNSLYLLRNKIVHEGWRLATFDLAKQGIASCKAAIKEIEDRLPGIANPIQIYSGVDHLQNTAGRLKF